MSLDLLTLHPLGDVVRNKECSRSRNGYVLPFGDVYCGNSSTMVMRRCIQTE